MEHSKKNKKDVKLSKPTHKQHAESVKKVPDAKSRRRGDSKQAALINLLARPGGATIDEMAKATGWQRHSIRVMMSGVLKKRLGLSIASEKS